jgi:hypothetical protein
MDGSMVITVSLMRIMEMAGDSIIRVIAVRDRIVSARSTVNMGLLMAAAGMRGVAGRWILPARG